MISSVTERQDLHHCLHTTAASYLTALCTHVTASTPLSAFSNTSDMLTSMRTATSLVDIVLSMYIMRHTPDSFSAD